MAIKLISITLNTPNPGQIIEFYSNLGFEFKAIKVNRGSEHHKARHGDIEFCIYERTDKKNSSFPSLQLGFVVKDLKDIFTRIGKVAGVTALMEPTNLPNGFMAIVKDPDGNSIEIVEG